MALTGGLGDLKGLLRPKRFYDLGVAEELKETGIALWA